MGRDNIRRVVAIQLLVFLIQYIVATYNIHAEGTRELQPISTQEYHLLINRGGGLNVPFAVYTPNTITYQAGTTEADYRLNVHVCEAGERIRLGFRGSNDNTFYRIKNSAGTVVFGPCPVPFLYNINGVVVQTPGTQLRIQTSVNHGFIAGERVTISGVGGIPSANGTFTIVSVPAANRFVINVTSTAGTYTAGTGNVIFTNGNINSWNEAVAGPRSFVGPAGYLDTGFVAPAPGDYYIEFNRGNRNTYSNNQTRIRWYDVTVYNSANVEQRGRLWSKSWHLADVNNPFNGTFFIYADDGIVTRLAANGMEPHWFSISCNPTGLTNTGNANFDRQSKNGPLLYPQYKIFINDPDIDCYPTGSFGEILSPITITGCGTNRCINVNVDKPGNLVITLDLNGIPGFQLGTVDRQIGATVVAGMNCIPWDGLDNFGNEIADGFTFDIQVDYLNGITHMPLYDCEDNRNGFIVTLHRPAGPVPRLFWDDTQFIPSGTALDGIINLTGCAVPTGCHRWINRGNNACPPCSETINTWWYANIITQTVTYRNTNITVDANTNSPGTGFANNNFNACKLPTPINLNGGYTGATAVTWTTTGTGVIANPNAAVTTYTPSAADIAYGSVKLVLTATHTICPSESDSLLITLVNFPTVNAGTDKTVCKNNPQVILSDATQSNTDSIRWFGGTGTFIPNRNTLTPSYIPSAAELTGSFIDLTLTGYGNIACPNSTDIVRINFANSPTVNAGPDRTVCSNNLVVTNINGSFSNATSVQWTSLSGCQTCFSSPNTAVTNYTPSATDIANGSVSLVLTASRAGCLSVSDTMLVTIFPAPTVHAGADQSLCKNNNVATLSGSVTGTTTFFWSSSSGCAACFSSTTSLTPTYTPSATDLANNSVTLTLTATLAECTNVTDQITISYTNAPTVNAGANGIVCRNNPCYNLNATFTGATGVQWGWGTGTFTPNITTANANYCLSDSELSAQLAVLTVTTTGNGNCSSVTDTMLIIVLPSQTVSAGPDRTVCFNNPTLTLNGSASVGTVQWTSLSMLPGNFSNANSAVTNYTLSPSELTTGTVYLVLTAFNAPFCNPVRDTMMITVTPAPTVNAGSDQNGICRNPGIINLNGFSSTGSGVWSGGAGGTFSPNANTLNATYTASAADKAAGSVTLTLTTTGNGNCNPVSDNVTFTFAPLHVVDAGTYAPVCANNPSIDLTGTSTTGGGQWSGGTGTFVPGSNSLITTYTPSAAEISAGSVTLTLTSTGNGGCAPVTDQVTISITPAPTIMFNPSTINICADNPIAPLNASVTVATGIIWSGGSGIFTPNNTTENATYQPTLAEILAGSLTLTATTTGNGNCNSVSANLPINIAPAPIVNAGADQVLCGSTTSANLNGMITGATGGIWTTSGTGTFANPNALVTTYMPSAADKTAGIVILTLTSTGNGTCNAVSDQLQITFTVVPTVNAGPDQIVCSNAFPVILNGSGSPATWSGGAGTYSPSPSVMNASYTPAAAEIGTTVILTLTTNPQGACPQVSDQVAITIVPSPVANAGPDQTICGNISSFNIMGGVTNATGGFWETSGTGSFGNPTMLNTTYTPSATDKLNGTVILSLITTGNGSCLPDTDFVVISISPAVTVFAGPDQNLCGDGNPINLSAVITGATGGSWVTSGSGTFANPASAVTTYTPSAADIIAGTVTLTVTTTGNPPSCAALSDALTITLSPVPIANAGADQTVCADVASVTLNGSVMNAIGGQWSTTGAGTFSPNNTTLNAQYIPAPGETGTFTFTLTTTGNGVCTGPFTDQVQITITPAPTINAGPNQTLCANNPVATLNGMVTVATGGSWATSGTGVFANSTSLNTTYTPSAADIANGSVTLTLTSTGNGACNPVSDVLVLIFTPAPTITAGPDRSVCANNANVNLLGIVTVATGGVWSTSGDGTFSGTSSNGLSTTYTPGTNDIMNGMVNITITSTGNDNCLPVNDILTVTITPAPTVDAGPDQTICADSFYVALDANFTVATAGIWTSSGSGSFFNNNATSDTAIYVPSVAERNSAPVTITLTFTTTNHGACNPVSDQMTVTITPAPVITVGSDQTICSTTNSINISGTNNGVSPTVLWTTSGSGTFANASSLSTTYTPSAVDKAAGSVTLTLTSTINGTCRPAFDQMDVTIIPQPIVNAGADRTICADLLGDVLTPTVTNYSSVNWTTSGTGVFGPNSSTLNATYYPSAADKAVGTVTVTLTANGLAPCSSASDNFVYTIRPVPVVNAGPDQRICANSNVTLNGIVTNASGGVWTTSGSGTFAPDANTLNAIYIPSSADTMARTVTLTLTSTGMGSCNPVSDQMTITFDPVPSVNAGADQVICADNENIFVFGTVANATGGTWTSSGTGGFFPSPNKLNSIYYISSQDSINGFVVLTLTTTGTGACPAVSDNMILTITPVPTAEIGPNFSVCNGTTSVALSASITVAPSGYWSTFGDGSFDNEVSLTPVYTFGPNDIMNGTVLITFITQNNGACHFYTDSLRITFTALATVNAGADRTICRTDFPIHLQGSGSAGYWKTLGTGVFSDTNALAAIYYPSIADAMLPSLKLVLTPLGACAGMSDTVEFTFIDGPIVDAGVDQNICTNVHSVTLAAVASEPGTWTSNGSGSFNNPALTNAIYTLSTADKISGFVKLTYTIPAGMHCRAQMDDINIFIHPTPTVSAGPDKTVCANALNMIILNGTFSIAGGVQWTKLDNMGFGTLNDATSANAQYTPDPTDVPFTPIRFEIQTTGNGFCSIQRDTMNLIITPTPTANIGADTTVCADHTISQLAQFTVATGGIWTTSGTGIFTPSNTSPFIVYTPSSADTAASSVTLTFTTTGNGICNAVSDNKIINITPKPIVIAGIDDTICSGQDSVGLSFNFLNTPGVYWTTTGTGTFSPSNTATSNVFYRPSAADKANGGVIIRLASTGVMECDSVFDYKRLKIVPSPLAIVNAGFDQVICEDDPNAQLSGMILIATGAEWSCQSGPCSGTFTDVTDLNAKYIVGPTDVAGTTLTLRLTTTTGNGICDPVYDEMLLTIIPKPVVNAGADFTVCGDVTTIPLNGVITAHPFLMPPGYHWVSSGTGVFAPNAFVANPVYIPSAADIASGLVAFTLKSTNNGTCEVPQDIVYVTITPRPTINAGPDKTTCTNVPNVNLVGIATGATGAIWSTSGTGVFAPNSFTATYTPSAADRASGTVVLTIASTGTGTCNQVTDQMILTIVPQPVVNAGAPQTVCANSTVSLNGSVVNATGGNWTSTGGGYFIPNGTALNAVYRPSSSDTLAGMVNLILTSTGNGTCLPEDDTVTIHFDPVPLVNAGTAILCTIQQGASLSGAVANSAGGIWSTSGTGVFAPNSTALNATYYPSLADEAAGSVILTLQTTGNASCTASSSTLNLAIVPLPQAIASQDEFVCRNSSVILSAQPFSNITTYQWALSGGAVISNLPSVSITAVADQDYVLTVFDSKNCASVNDTVRVRVFDMPTAIHLNGTNCFSDSNVVNATLVPGAPPVPAIYQWYKNNQFMTGQNGSSIYPNSHGSFTVSYSYGACVVNGGPFVIHPRPQISGIDKTNCVNNITTISTSASSGLTFAWTSTNPATILGPTDQSTLIVQHNLSFDTVSYNVTATDMLTGCSISDSVYLVTVEKPLLTLQNDTACQYQTRLLSAAPSNFGGANPPLSSYDHTYIWTKDGVNLNHNYDTLTVTSPGTYIVELIIGDCNSNKDTSVVIYNKLPVPLTLPTEMKFCDERGPVMLDGTTQEEPGKTYTYSWQPTGENTPVIETAIEGLHVVTITVTLGPTTCTNADSINLKNVCPPRIYVPNVFTPGVDGPNKIFNVFGAHFKNYKLMVFNRWGEIIFTSTDRAIGWDGTYRGEPMPVGVYPFIIEYEGEMEEMQGPFKMEGEVLILR